MLILATQPSQNYCEALDETPSPSRYDSHSGHQGNKYKKNSDGANVNLQGNKTPEMIIFKQSFFKRAFDRTFNQNSIFKFKFTVCLHFDKRNIFQTGAQCEIWKLGTVEPASLTFALSLSCGELVSFFSIEKLLYYLNH